MPTPLSSSACEQISARQWEPPVWCRVNKADDDDMELHVSAVPEGEKNRQAHI